MTVDLEVSTTKLIMRIHFYICYSTTNFLCLTRLRIVNRHSDRFLQVGMFARPSHRPIKSGTFSPAGSFSTRNFNVVKGSEHMMCITVKMLIELFQKKIISIRNTWNHISAPKNYYYKRVFTNDPGNLGLIPGRVIPKTLKMVLCASVLNTQYFKLRIKGKAGQSWERSSTLSYTLV